MDPREQPPVAPLEQRRRITGLRDEMPTQDDALCFERHQSDENIRLRNREGARLVRRSRGPGSAEPAAKELAEGELTHRSGLERRSRS